MRGCYIINKVKPYIVLKKIVYLHGNYQLINLQDWLKEALHFILNE